MTADRQTDKQTYIQRFWFACDIRRYIPVNLRMIWFDTKKGSH